MARPEQTEKPTPKRRSEARSKGQVARSADLSGSLTFLTTIMMLHYGFAALMNSTGAGMRWSIQHAARKDPLNVHSVGSVLLGWMNGALLPLVALFLTVMAVGVLVNFLQVGFHPSLKVLNPNFSRLNPLNGIKRLVSAQTAVNLAKQLFKLSLVTILMYQSLHGSLPKMLALADASPATILTTVEDQIYGMGLRFGGFLFALGLVDFLWERHRLEESLKMTKSEVRDEQKQQEGSREAKGQFRRRQREISRRRMMTSVPKATVVITNPTHFAVALYWDEDTMVAPVVTAKGADLMAKRIRDLARDHTVPIVENPPLARQLYRDVQIDSAVPVEMYAAVARVIAFVFALRTRPTKGTMAQIRYTP